MANDKEIDINKEEKLNDGIENKKSLGIISDGIVIEDFFVDQDLLKEILMED